MSLLPLFLKLLVLLRKSRGNQTHMQERVSSEGKCQRVLCAKVTVGPGSLPKATRRLKTLFSRTPNFAEFVFATLSSTQAKPVGLKCSCQYRNILWVFRKYRHYRRQPVNPQEILSISRKSCQFQESPVNLKKVLSISVKIHDILWVSSHANQYG